MRDLVKSNIDAALKQCRCTMEITVHIQPDELEEAHAYLAGKRGAKCIDFSLAPPPESLEIPSWLPKPTAKRSSR